MSNKYYFEACEKKNGEGWIYYFYGIADGRYLKARTKGEAEKVTITDVTFMEKVLRDLKEKYPSFSEFGVQVAGRDGDEWDVIKMRAEVAYVDAVKKLEATLSEGGKSKQQIAEVLKEVYEAVQKSANILEVI